MSGRHSGDSRLEIGQLLLAVDWVAERPTHERRDHVVAVGRCCLAVSTIASSRASTAAPGRKRQEQVDEQGVDQHLAERSDREDDAVIGEGASRLPRFVVRRVMPRRLYGRSRELEIASVGVEGGKPGSVA
jgi:hypothetical protein